MSLDDKSEESIIRARCRSHSGKKPGALLKILLQDCLMMRPKKRIWIAKNTGFEKGSKSSYWKMRCCGIVVTVNAVSKWENSLRNLKCTNKIALWLYSIGFCSSKIITSFIMSDGNLQPSFIYKHASNQSPTQAEDWRITTFKKT